jgi:hypothetical protein
VQEDVADGLAGGRAAGLAQRAPRHAHHAHRQTAGGQGRAEAFDLGRLTRTVDAFEGYEEAAPREPGRLDARFL